MSAGFRDCLRELEDAGELVRLKKAVDPRHLSALMAQSPHATLFEKIAGYPDWRAAGAVLSTRKRLAIAMGCSESAIATRFEDGIRRPIDARLVDQAPCQDVVLTGDEVDLTRLPLPMMHVKDGGPYISATLVVSKDPEYGRNVGSYRMMYRSPRETGIDLVSSSDMRVYYQRALDQGRPLEIAVAVGVHPFEMLAASYKAPIAVDEFAIAGGLHGAPVDLVRCKTVDLEVPASAEFVLEGELLPIGWTADEGPFGEFSHITGEVKWNPIFRVRAITRRAIRSSTCCRCRGRTIGWPPRWSRRPGSRPCAWRASSPWPSARRSAGAATGRSWPRSGSALARARTRCWRCCRSPR
jgi:2,5-furandicarboxylate decarboxylase 1